MKEKTDKKKETIRIKKSVLFKHFMDDLVNDFADSWDEHKIPTKYLDAVLVVVRRNVKNHLQDCVCDDCLSTLDKKKLKSGFGKIPSLPRL